MFTGIEASATTIVIPYLDKPTFTQYIENITKELNQLQLKSWPDYYDALQKYFDIDEPEM